MSTITETLNENQRKYAQAFRLGHLAMPPARKLGNRRLHRHSHDGRANAGLGEKLETHTSSAMPADW